MPKLNRAARRREAKKAANRTPGQQAQVDQAVKIVMAGKPLGSKKVDVIPECKFPACHTRAWTTRGLCHKHEELFQFLYFLFSVKKSTGLILPGEQEGGKPMTNFDILIRGK